MFAERIEKVKNTKIELDSIKIVDCYLDCHGIYDSNLVSFKIKSLYTNHFLKFKEICINQRETDTYHTFVKKFFPQAINQ